MIKLLLQATAFYQTGKTKGGCPKPVPALALGGVGSLPRASQLQKEGPSSCRLLG